MPPATEKPVELALSVRPLTVLKVGVGDEATVIVPAALLVVVIFDPAAKVRVPPWATEEFEPVVAARVNKLPPLTIQVGQLSVSVLPKETAEPPLRAPVVLIIIVVVWAVRFILFFTRNENIY